jgi:DNA-binding SARP family transcriptional activator
MLLSSSYLAREAEDQPIRIRLLGGVNVQGLRGAGLGNIEGRTHVRALIALVGSSSLGVSRDEVADVLWPRQSASAARNRLYHTMHLARQALSDLAWSDEWIVLQHGRILLDSRAISDAQQLEAATGNLGALDDATLLKVTELCVGDWAPEVDAGALGQSIRRHLRSSHIALLREGAQRLADAGDVPARRDLLLRILAQSDTDEWAYRQLMELDLAARRPHAVLRLYESASRSMVEQLGLRPSPALADLAKAAAQTLSVQVPKDPGTSYGHRGLVGRGTLIQTVVREMQSGPGAWNIYGLSGVGKTALMEEVMGLLDTVSPDGSYWVSLTDVDPQIDPWTLVLRRVGVEPDPQVESASQLAQWLSKQRVVLVLDDLDTLGQWRDLLPLLVPELGRVVLITHRALHEPHIRDIAIPPLAVPSANLPMAQARQSAAVALFQMCRSQVDLQPTSEADWRQWFTLVRRLDGLPLALELAAAQTVAMTAGEILREMDGEGASLAFYSASERHQRRHRSLRAALDFSVALLSENAQRLYRALGVFDEEFSEKATAPLALAAQVPLHVDLSPLLQELEDAGLLVRASDTLRYKMLNLTRNHAARCAVEAELWPSIVAAQLDSVIEQLESGACGYESPGYTDWMTSVLVLENDAKALLPLARETDPARFLRLLIPQAHVWSLRALPTTLLEWMDQGLVVARQLNDVAAEITLLTHAALLCLEARQLDDALRYSAPAMELVQHQMEDPAAAAYTVAVRAQTLHAGVGATESVELLQAWLDRLDPQKAGYWTVWMAFVRIGQAQAEVSRDPAAVLNSLRDRMDGSRTCWDLLLAFSDGVAGADAEFRITVANELLVSARNLRSPRRAEFAFARLAWAQLSLDRTEASAATVYEWYRMSRSEGREAQAAIACVWLAEAAWREDDTLTAKRWLGDTRQLLQQHETNTLYQSVCAHAVIVSVLEGDLDASMAHFLSIGAEVLVRCRTFPLLEQATEAGALLARTAGLEHLTQTLSEALSIISSPNNQVPVVQRFRERHLGLKPLSAEARTPQAVDEASGRARRDLDALYRFCRSSLRSSPLSPTPN